MNLKDIENSNKFFKEGNKQYDLDNLNVALKEYSKSVHLNPNNLDAFFNRGCVKRDLKDYQGAISDFSKVIEISPQNTTAIFNRGIIKFQVEDYYSAIDDFTKVILYKNDFEDAYFQRGLAKAKIKNFGGSIEDLSKAISIKPTFVDAIYSRGRVKQLIFDDSSEKDIVSALKLNPDYKDVYFKEESLPNKKENIDNKNEELERKSEFKFLKVIGIAIVVIPIIVFPSILIFRNFSSEKYLPIKKKDIFTCQGSIKTMFGKIPTTFKTENESFSWEIDGNSIDAYGGLAKYFKKGGPFTYGVQTSEGVLVRKINENQLSVKFYWINGTFLKSNCTLELPLTFDSLRQLPKYIPLLEYF